MAGATALVLTALVILKNIILLKKAMFGNYCVTKEKSTTPPTCLQMWLKINQLIKNIINEILFKIFEHHLE